jgi:hypothetical protein
MARSNRRGRAIVMLAVLGPIACASARADDYRARQDSITDGLGNAAAHNIAVHTIDPWPASSRNPRVNLDGERALIAVGRYKANRSIPPRGLTTQTINVQDLNPGLGIAPR